MSATARFTSAALTTLISLTVGCGGSGGDKPAGDKPEAEAATKVEASPTPAKSAVADKPANPAQDTKPAAPSKPTDPAKAAVDDDAKPADDSAKTPGDARPAETAVDPVKEALKAVTDPKLADTDAIAKLNEAKKAGAKTRKLAKAATARGNKLFATPDRAKAMFEWAQNADKKYADATFALAKLAANTGNVAEVKTLLTEVAKRGGKKLLDQVEFDPTFALVADDPDIRALRK